MCDNLESLDNSSLREKCIQYGLPNVPVTDSSRKVLIRRLRMTMDDSNVSALNKMNSGYTLPSTAKSKRLFDDLNTSSRKTNFIEKSKTTVLQPTKRLRAANKISCNKLHKEEPVAMKDIVDPSMCENRAKCRVSNNYTLHCGRNESTNNTGVKNVELHSSYVLNLKDQIVERLDKSTDSKNFYSEHMCKETVPVTVNRNNTHFYKDRDYKEEQLLNAPYLSDFARSLERLKNDSRGRLRLSSQISMQGRNKTVNETAGLHQPLLHQCDVDETFKEFLIALERKYHLKRNSIIIFSVLLVVFIFVFFIM